MMQMSRKMFEKYRTFVLTNECSPAIIKLVRTNVSFKEDFTMALSDIILTVFEFAAVVLLIVGFINEKKIIAFEVKLARAIRIHLRNRRVRKQRELAAAHANAQKRAPADEIEETPVISITDGKIKNFHVA